MIEPLKENIDKESRSGIWRKENEEISRKKRREEHKNLNEAVELLRKKKTEEDEHPQLREKNHGNHLSIEREWT